MIHERQNKHGRRSLTILSLNAALLIAIGLILPLTTVHAAPVVTTVSVQDQNGYAPQAKVTVINAQSGQQVANGLTDLGTGLFTFRSNNGTDLIVVVQSSNGYLASARVRPGDFAAMVALRKFWMMPGTDPMSGTQLVGSQGGAGASSAQNQKIQELSFSPSTSSPTGDFSKALVAVVGLDTFEQVARGQLNKEGQFTFGIPEDMATSVFLAAVWGREGSIMLVRLVKDQPNGTSFLLD